MKVYLVWYMYPYEPTYEVLKVFKNEENAKNYVASLLSNPNEDFDKQDLYIEERKVE